MQERFPFEGFLGSENYCVEEGWWQKKVSIKKLGQKKIKFRHFGMFAKKNGWIFHERGKGLEVPPFHEDKYLWKTSHSVMHTPNHVDK